MTATTITSPRLAAGTPHRPARAAATHRRDVESAVDRLLSALVEADLDEQRWRPAGPLVAAATHELRRALGLGATSSTPSTAVALEADFAIAARRLQAGSPVVEATAATRFLRAAERASLALA